MRDVDRRPESATALSRKCAVLLVGSEETHRILASKPAALDFEVTFARDMARGLGHAFRGHFDLVVIDADAPGIDGFEVLRRLRERDMTPVIILGRHTAAQDRVSALEGGADDYLHGPFALRELVPRIRAVLRRVRSDRQTRRNVLHVAGVSLDLRAAQVKYRNAAVRVSAHQSELLAALMRRAGGVVNRDELAEGLSSKDTFSERWVDVQISHLRRKLASIGARDVIRTVRSIGYLFTADDGRTRREPAT